ncbi:uncharacterized protein I206_103762 [Kwoniella pini CBS 10737]|uniref:Uncharacterized protein n=1 Tax=Kwoniella pini CBS 10737 TaxID=1296096 RepID=A0A1B9HSI7_9TREE|nr:uncharacterized protein I206_07711 [Kwoniella pini CBS 10737]OCF46234.1 hypothetical protein I206_07711 [Kwoniella pini CBS 10737]
MSSPEEGIIPCRNRLTIPKFTSKIQPPSTLPLRTTSKIRQPQTTGRPSTVHHLQVAGSLNSESKIPPPRVSFLTPREIWSPLATPIPGMQQIKQDIRAGAAPARVPKYQLKDPGPIPQSASRSHLSTTPKPQIRPRLVSRPSIKAHRQASVQRPPAHIPRPPIRPSQQFTPTQQASRLPLPSSTNRARPLSLPPDEASSVIIPHTRPTSYQPSPSFPLSASPSYLSKAVGIPEPRPLLSQPIHDQLDCRVPGSIAPSRETSNQSTGSSVYSSASSLARHRAIKGRGKDRSSFARLSAYSPPNHDCLVKALCAESESEDTESTLSDHSIRTVATVNQVVNVENIPIRHLSLSASINSPERSLKEEPVSEESFMLSSEDHRGLTAPYLVPSSAPPMTLEWESDESSGEVDEAERVWKELEAKLGRKVRGRSLRRGKWVVKPREHPVVELTPSLDTRNMKEEGVDMEKTASGFSLSMYFSPQSSRSTPPLDIDRCRSSSFTYDSSPIVASPSSATALFDMSAPLVPGGIDNGCTPWNTPLVNTESIKRGTRVKKRFASMDVAEIGQKNRLGSLEEVAKIDFTPQQSQSREISSRCLLERGLTTTNPDQEDSPDDCQTLSPPIGLSDLHGTQTDHNTAPRMMYRLDSHIVSALSALQGSYDSPDLDFALSSSPPLSPASDVATEEDFEGSTGNGLGLGMNLRLRTIYHLPTLSPRLRPSAVRTATKTASRIESSNGNSMAIDPTQRVDETMDYTLKSDSSSQIPEVNEEDDEEVLVIRDLDTGLERQVKVGDGLTLT